MSDLYEYLYLIKTLCYSHSRDCLHMNQNIEDQQMNGKERDTNRRRERARDVDWRVGTWTVTDSRVKLALARQSHTFIVLCIISYTFISLLSSLIMRLSRLCKMTCGDSDGDGQRNCDGTSTNKYTTEWYDADAKLSIANTHTHTLYCNNLVKCAVHGDNIVIIIICRQYPVRHINAGCVVWCATNKITSFLFCICLPSSGIRSSLALPIGNIPNPMSCHKHSNKNAINLSFRPKWKQFVFHYFLF